MPIVVVSLYPSALGETYQILVGAGGNQIMVWNDDCVNDDIQPSALHKAEVLRLSLVSKVQPHAIMGTGLVEYVIRSP